MGGFQGGTCSLWQSLTGSPHRAQSLRSARAAYDDYRHGHDHVLQFLSSITSYEPLETDSLSQMETKLKNQKVRQLLLRSQTFGHKRVGGQRSASPFCGGSQVAAATCPDRAVSSRDRVPARSEHLTL